MNKRERLQAARELERDCTIGAGAGLGMYTREDSERRRGMRGSPSSVAHAAFGRVLLDRDPSEGPVRSEREAPLVLAEAV
jgi:hypothetical protein